MTCANGLSSLAHHWRTRFAPTMIGALRVNHWRNERANMITPSARHRRIVGVVRTLASTRTLRPQETTARGGKPLLGAQEAGRGRVSSGKAAPKILEAER